MTIFQNQIDAAQAVRDSFKIIPYVILLAQMQSGKTGTFKLVGAEMLREGIVDRVVIFSGNRETDLRKQTEDINGKFSRSYLKYLLNLDMNPFDAIDESHKIVSKFEVVWGPYLKRFVPHSRTLYIWDESHYGQTQNQEVDKFLTRIGIQATGIVPEGSFVLSVSATPMSELCDKTNLSQSKKIIYMEPETSYIGVERLLENKQLVSINPDEIIQTLETFPLENYGIVRASEKKQDAIFEVATNKNWSVIQHDMDNDEDLNLILSTPPSKPTLVLIKGKMRMGKQLQKKNVSFCMETSKPKTDTFLQGLTGRCCGYIGGEDFANESIKIYVVNIDFEEIRRYLNMLNDFISVPFKATNVLSSPKPQNYYISPIIFKMNEHMTGATIKDERDDLSRHAWSLIDKMEDNPQTIELKNRDRSKYMIRRTFKAARAEPTDELFSRLRFAASSKQPFHPGSIYGYDKNNTYSIYIWCIDESTREYAVISATINPPIELSITPKTTGLEVFCKTSNEGAAEEAISAITHTGYIDEGCKDDADILEKCLKEAIEVSRTKGKFVNYTNKITSTESILLSPSVFETLQSSIRSSFKQNGVLLNWEKMRGRNPTHNEYIRLKEISWSFTGSNVVSTTKTMKTKKCDEDDDEEYILWKRRRDEFKKKRLAANYGLNPEKGEAIAEKILDDLSQ